MPRAEAWPTMDTKPAPAETGSTVDKAVSGTGDNVEPGRPWTQPSPAAAGSTGDKAVSGQQDGLQEGC